jgi:hypothetical protein
LKRQGKLPVRQAEGMYIGRAMGLNKEKTKPFYEVLKSVLFEGEMLVVPESDVFITDETGLTICQRPQKIVAQKKKNHETCLSCL